MSEVASLNDRVKQADEIYRQLVNDGSATAKDVLAYIQRHIVVPKSQQNDFAGFSYRSLGDIHDALEPWLVEQLSCITYHEDLESCGQYVYVVSTCTLHTPYGDISAKTPARDAIQKTKSDAAQITGMAVTYARKYAAGGLFRLDTEKDPDSQRNDEPQAAPTPPAGGLVYAECPQCHQVFGPLDQSTLANSVCPTCNRNDWIVRPSA